MEDETGFNSMHIIDNISMVTFTFKIIIYKEEILGLHGGKI